MRPKNIFNDNTLRNLNCLRKNLKFKVKQQLMSSCDVEQLTDSIKLKIITVKDDIDRF